MVVPEGTFRIYPRITPPLTAGDYRLTSSQELSASRPSETLDSDDLRVDPLQTHVRVRSPQYQLPPDQVLSTFPPAGSEGAYGSRLPQVVIRRRTLPWERTVQEGHEDQPWLALVLIAEGEAEMRLNQPVADCVTSGVVLDTPADVELGNALAIRKSVVDRVFPTREEVKLLAHAREVDIADTELMMGDDDGYLAVVIGNRLPLPGRDADGNEVPVKYLACLVNLSEQFDQLLEKAPTPVTRTRLPFSVTDTVLATLADYDHASMGSAGYTKAPGGSLAGPVAAGAPASAPAGTGPARPTATPTALGDGLATPYSAKAGWSKQVAGAATESVAAVYTAMAEPFRNAAVSGFLGGNFIQLDRTLVFPVLLHWGFTSTGQMTFRRLMEQLDSGLLGTPQGQRAEEVVGRPPFESVETGHVGLAHTTRRGDPVRSWYRGPLVPHPTADPPEGRLPLAHTADQVRVVVPDGREDISLAGAFEIGRLLALSRPSTIASLLRWRQLGYQAAQRAGALAAQGSILAELGVHDLQVERDLGGRLGGILAEAIVARPEHFLGDPAPLVRPGREVRVADLAGAGGAAVNAVLAAGLGVKEDTLAGTASGVLTSLQDTTVRVPQPARAFDAGLLNGVLQPRLVGSFERVAYGALADDPQLEGIVRDAVLRRHGPGGGGQ